ncbi:MAG TPA: VanZ family protein, partial [Calditrichaeota bacterium]|nr:VanZ family protein [Calditrichota bacterium]
MDDKARIRFIKILLATFMFFVVYNTLIPFKIYLSPGKLLREFNQIDWTPYFHNGRFNSLTDIVGNIILFLPFGFLFYLHQYYSQKTAPLLRVMIFGFLFSLSIETAQVFFKYRITSVTDLCNNTLGALGGAFAAKIYLTMFEEQVR